MYFDEIMFSPLQARDIGRASLIPPMMMPGPIIYPYYGIQPLQGQVRKDTFSPAVAPKANKKDQSFIKALLGVGTAFAGLLLLKKGVKRLKGGKIPAVFDSIKSVCKKGYDKVATFTKNIFSKIKHK